MSILALTHPRKFLVSCAALAALVYGCGEPPPDTRAADEAAIMKADAAWSADRGWGRVASYSAKGLLNQTPYDKMRETGWYTSGASTPLQYRFTLPAGTYHVVARKGSAEVRETVAVKAGDSAARTLMLRLARLSLSARLPGTPGGGQEPAA